MRASSFLLGVAPIAPPEPGLAAYVQKPRQTCAGSTCASFPLHRGLDVLFFYVQYAKRALLCDRWTPTFRIVFALVQAEHVPLEDELEALCRLHAARAELVLSGDLESFIGVASTVEAFPFREDDDSEDEEEAADFAPPPAMFAFSPSPGGAGRGQGMLDDGRRRRLAALENCLDAFDRLGNFSLASNWSLVLSAL